MYYPDIPVLKEHLVYLIKYLSPTYTKKEKEIAV